VPSVTTPICTKGRLRLRYDAMRLHVTFQVNSSGYPRQYDSMPVSMMWAQCTVHAYLGNQPETTCPRTPLHGQ
jgi:hypothetical protein